MTELPANYFSAALAPAQPVRLRWHAFDGCLEILDLPAPRRVRRRDLIVEPRHSATAQILRLHDGARLEIALTADSEPLLATWGLHPGKAHREPVEVHWTMLAAVALLIAALAIAAFHWGVPWAARRVAFALPADVLKSVGDETLAAMDRTTLQPSKLTHERQLEIEKAFAALLRENASGAGSRSKPLEFRAAPAVGPNAFALPSGAIVLTDELVQLAGDDREIVAVLAHELGHVEQRHAVRGVLQKSALSLVVSLFTGDVSSGFATALPSFLLEARYSRAFEREADAFAVEQLRAANLSPDYLAQMLERLRARAGEADHPLIGYLQTHPPTPERIEAIRRGGR